MISMKFTIAYDHHLHLHTNEFNFWNNFVQGLRRCFWKQRPRHQKRDQRLNLDVVDLGIVPCLHLLQSTQLKMSTSVVWNTVENLFAIGLRPLRRNSL